MKPLALMGKMASDEATIPDIRELLAHINDQLGGLQAYAAMVAADVLAAPPGSSQRLTFHNNYLASVAKFGGNDDLANLNISELESEAQRIMDDQSKSNGNGETT